MFSLKQPNNGTGQKNEWKEAGVEFVIPSSNTAKLLELVEESLDEIAIFVRAPIDGTLFSPHLHPLQPSGGKPDAAAQGSFRNTFPVQLFIEFAGGGCRPP